MLVRMRVIAGEFRSRRLLAPPGQGTRPTSDKLRETLFNVLGSRIEGARFADLYAGSGAVGIEALSRGAAFCCFAEHSPAALKALRANLAALGIENGFAVEARGTGALLQQARRERREAFDVVFLDPPYTAEREYGATLGTLAAEHRELLNAGAMVVAEHARKLLLPPRFGLLARTRLLEQGDAALSFYTVDRAGTC